VTTRRYALVTTLVSGAFCLTGCTASSPMVPAASSPTVPAARPAGPASTAAVARSTPLAGSVLDCGTYLVGQDGRWPSKGTSCLIDADAGGRKARLTVTVLSVEGSPIPNRYEALGTGEVVVTMDFTRDYARGGVTTWICTIPKVLHPSGQLTFEHCLDAKPSTGPSGRPARLPTVPATPA
jgi:hypothetical protein